MSNETVTPEQAAAKLATEVAALLKKHDKRIVFAESCTGGMVSALLAGIPGISENLCGSFVVYRNNSKEEWLSISRKRLKDLGEVSREIAVEMAESALKRTPEAELSVSITGHLGPLSGPPRGPQKTSKRPSASNNQDGLIFIGISHRSSGQKTRGSKSSKNSAGFGMSLISVVQEFHLPGTYPTGKTGSKSLQAALDLRLRRQMLASAIVLTLVRELLIA